MALLTGERAALSTPAPPRCPIPNLLPLLNKKNYLFPLAGHVSFRKQLHKYAVHTVHTGWGGESWTKTVFFTL
jgi:hypothetical protein